MNLAWGVTIIIALSFSSGYYWMAVYFCYHFPLSLWIIIFLNLFCFAVKSSPILSLILTKPCQYDVILCSETLVSNRRSVSELLLPNFDKPKLVLRDLRPRVRGLATYVRTGYTASVRSDFTCNCYET